jgi:VWFA-related protein
MNFYSKKCFCLAFLTILLSLLTYSQTPDEPIKINTEEVLLNVRAQTANGKFVSTLKPEDLLIVESGDPQKIESMRKVPASVLLLLDTGGELNFAKSLKMTRLTAKLLIEKLSPNNTFAVAQSYNKYETVSDWTKDRSAVQTDLDRKLFGGRRARFSDSINDAINTFQSRPLENRHLIFIGDGLDTFPDPVKRKEAIQNLLSAGITVHFIAYNKMETTRAKPLTRRFQIGEEREAPRIPEQVLEGIIQSLPVKMKDEFRRFAVAERLFVIRLDNNAIKLTKQKIADWKQSETEMQSIAEDTGGIFQSPEQYETMWSLAQEIAQAIDSQYVVTYIPKKSFSESEKGGVRKIRVGTHCDGVIIHSRQKLVTAKSD